jgi:hypothetical protein
MDKTAVEKMKDEIIFWYSAPDQISMEVAKGIMAIEAMGIACKNVAFIGSGFDKERGDNIIKTMLYLHPQGYQAYEDDLKGLGVLNVFIPRGPEVIMQIFDYYKKIVNDDISLLSFVIGLVDNG